MEEAIVSEQKQKEIYLEDIVRCVQQTITLVGQIFPTLAHNHQVLVLSAVMNNQKKEK